MQGGTGKVGDTAIRHVLRAQTQDVHEQLHGHTSFAGLLNGSLDLAGYRELVKRLYGFYEPLDKAIIGVLAEAPRHRNAFSYVGRSGLLRRDLIDLDVVAAEIDNLPLCRSAHDIISLRSIGGVLYVIEGATRGGSLINRSAIRLLGSVDRGGRSYWQWCRSQQNTQWRKINAYLDHLSSEGAEAQDLVTGAADTFRLFAEWLAPLDRPLQAESSVM